LSFNYVENSSIGGIGSIQNIWSFAGIEGRGYPLLNDRSGRLMAGQQ